MQEAAFSRAFARHRPDAIYERCEASQLVLHTLTQGSYPDPDGVTQLWQWCADKGVPTASLHLDLFYGLASPKDQGPQRQDLPREHPMFRVAHVFTPDGGHDDLWLRDGVNHHWLPPGVSHTECIDVGPDAPQDPDTLRIVADAVDMRRLESGRYLVGFAGSDGYHPEWPHRPQLVQWLRATYGDRFLHIGGSSTPRMTHLALNRIFASVPVWVGDSCMTRPDFPYWSDRVPETWGRGGFLIHPRVDAMAEHYSHYHLPGKIWVAGDWDALEYEIEFYLDPPGFRRDELRRVIADHTRRHDTYVNRVQTMLEVMEIT